MRIRSCGDCKYFGEARFLDGQPAPRECTVALPMWVSFQEYLNRFSISAESKAGSCDSFAPDDRKEANESH